VDLKPRYVRLTGYVGDQVSVPVTILPTSKYPFKITGVSTRGGTAIRHTLTERPASQGGGYTLLVENKKAEKGRYMDILTLTTDSDIQPRLTIRVYGNILEQKKTEPSTETLKPSSTGS